MPRRRVPLINFVPWIFLVILGGIALASSFMLYQVQRELESFSICRIAPGFDCAPALKSRYGRLFGIPLSSYAFAYYLFCLAVSLQPLFRKRVAERNALVMTALTALGSLFCGWLVWVSLTKLRAYCPFCLVLHVATPLMFFVSLWALALRQHPIKLIIDHEWQTIVEDRRILAGVVIAAVVVGIGLPTTNMLARRRLLQDHPSYQQIIDGNYPRFDELATLLKDRPFRGKADAAVTIVEFADFTCPVCMQARLAIEDLMKVYDIKFIYVNHPRSRECNPQAEDERPGACLGALVSQYALARGSSQFWKVYDGLNNSPNLLAESRADRLAHLAGAPSMNEILGDSAARESLQRDLDLARRAGVSHVPTFFINGMGVEGLPDDWFLVEVVERELDRARGGR